ncbi:hypothetical protein IWW36_002426 [Coemansia brasiliensis]|uniref:Uncharacterized protein n=1 Tax=Coemansia brasiliensis TaxID=2650707 RepID=A0A9W8M0M7_9FUNG|nr:hypothetical protein IWW36_002426 [Coemansia brasiliensis]
MPVSETSNAMRFAIEYPQSEVELPNVGTLTKLYDQPTAHHRIPKSALSSTFASLTQPISSLGPKESTDSGIDVIVEITLHAKNRRALQSPLVITLDPLIMADSETTATAASESPISSISSSDITIWNLATPTSGDLVSTPTAIVPMSTATISQHYLHHGDRAHRHRRSTTTYVLPADEANQLSSHQAHKAKLEHLGQATPSV